jgi:hypothetical protein
MREFSDQVATHQISIVTYGVRLRICTTSAEILKRIEPLLPPLSERVERQEGARRFGIIEEEDGTYSVYNSSTRTQEGATLDLALVVLDGQMRSYVAVNAVHASGLVFVHAGVVGHDGRGLVIPGDSFSGKTTLVAALVKRGATYYSDEYAVFDAEGRVHPYPKPLSLRPFDSTGEQVESPVESLGGVAGEEALPLGAAYVTYYVPGAEWVPRRLSRGEGALALMARAVPGRNRPEESMQALARAVKDAVVLQGERGEADEFAELMLNGAGV